MANTWPKERRVIGTKVQRLDGPDKATGRARYSYDINRPGMLHAMIVRCPFAHAKVNGIDTSAAEKLPGVKAFHQIAKNGAELFYAGEEVVAVAADTEEHARDAAQAIKVDYQVLPFHVRDEDAIQAPDIKTVPGSRGNVIRGAEDVKGKPDEALKQADVVAEGTYGVPMISHQCLESHGMVAEWADDGTLTVWCSTQATTGTAQALAQYFKIPVGKVKCLTNYMGGGFGSKFGPDIQGTVCCELAKKAKAPVKLMLDRAGEILGAGNRPSASATVKIAGTKDGKITAFEIDSVGGAGPLPYVYEIENTKVKKTQIRLNRGQARAMRAPGHPQSCMLTDTAVDDFAAKAGLDPMQVRLKNLPANDAESAQRSPTSYRAIRQTIYQKQLEIAAKLANWDKVWHPPGKGPATGPVKHGIGMAIHTWGGAGGANNDMTITISSDGSVLLQSSTQDLGTGARTVLAIVAAEVLGLEPTDITLHIGDSSLGRSTGSGGSTTCPGTAPAVLNAAIAARTELFKTIAARLEAKADDLAIEPGKIVDKANNKSWPWKQACAKIGMDTVMGKGNWTAGLSNNGVGGCQIAEVLVDTETGVVRCTKIIAVQDCGLIVNRLTCESQVCGGVIMGVNYALFEESIFDRNTGRQVNTDMEFYKLGGISDMPQIIVHMLDMPERGVIGIGEPPTISTATAISNAIHNAIGVRVSFTPFTPQNVLAALAKKGDA